MKLSHPLRRPFARLGLVCAATLAVGLLWPMYSEAATGASATTEPSPREEQRAAREAQRVTREAERQSRTEEREAQRTAREAERHARREKLSEERADRHMARPQIEGQDGHGCPVTLQASSTRITAGETVTLSGALVCPASTMAETPGQQVSLYERQLGAAAVPDLAPMQTVTAATDGSYEVTSAALYASTVLQVRFGTHHARVVVKVAPHITLTLSAPASAQSAADDTQHPRKRTKTTFSGAVSPVIEGVRVALQISYSAADEHWRTVAYGRVGAGGEYSIAHAFRIPGAAAVRAVVHPRGQYVVGVSETVPYEASQPQNPQLTIDASADPLSYGQQLTISGSAAGAPNQPVELLAFTQKGGLAKVAEGTTEADGDYTFTEEPLENTYYYVTNADQRSTTLFVDVAFALTLEAPPTTAQAGEQLTFLGTLTGAPEGQVVLLERGNAAGLGFHVVASGTVGPTGFQITHAFDHIGANAMRIKVPDDRDHRGSSSSPFTVTVTD